MKKISVLILVDKFDYHGSYINGPTRSYSRLIKRLDKNRFNVHLYVLRGKGKSDEIFKQENIKVSYFNSGKFNPFAFFNIIKVVLQKRIDILHLSGYSAATFGRIASVICRKPSIVHERWVDPKIGIFHCLFEKLLSKITTKAVATSKYAKKFLIVKKGMKEGKIVFIPNGVPLDDFRNVDDIKRQRKCEEFGIPNHVPIIGIVGMFDENKGHKYFIEAASLLCSKNPNARFLIIGDGEIRNRLEQQVSRLNLENYVMFLGHQNNMPEILKMLDIFVIASISETAPSSLLEAMAAKKAIITTKCGGPSEVIKDGLTGLIVPVKDSRAIADKIQYLIDNPSQKEILAENAQKDSENYNINNTVKLIQELYEETYLQSMVSRN